MSVLLYRPRRFISILNGMGVPFVEEEKEVEEDFAETASSVAWDLIPFSVLSRRESNPIKIRPRSAGSQA